MGPRISAIAAAALVLAAGAVGYHLRTNIASSSRMRGA
jgi:hypothetical protein